MSANQSPTILIVHGAWHSPKHMESAAELLNQQGFPTSQPALASVGGPATMTLYDDAQVIRAELDRLITNDGKDVIVVCHSYGGMVGTQVVDASLSKLDRKNKGLAGGVLHLVYLAAVLPHLDKNIFDYFGRNNEIFVEKDGLLEPPTASEHLFYNDLPVNEKAYFTSLLRSQTVVSFATPVTYAAWQHHPVSYIFCINDQIVPIELQRHLVAASGIEKNIRRFECDTGHSPFLSKPQVIVDVMKQLTEQSHSE